MLGEVRDATRRDDATTGVDAMSGVDATPAEFAMPGDDAMPGDWSGSGPGHCRVRRSGSGDRSTDGSVEWCGSH
jgi:hypothetical protein